MFLVDENHSVASFFTPLNRSLLFNKKQNPQWSVISENWCILLPDQIPLFACLYFVKYWVLCVSQLFVNQIVMS